MQNYEELYYKFENNTPYQIDNFLSNFEKVNEST